MYEVVAQRALVIDLESWSGLASLNSNLRLQLIRQLHPLAFPIQHALGLIPNPPNLLTPPHSRNDISIKLLRRSKNTLTKFRRVRSLARYCSEVKSPQQTAHSKEQGAFSHVHALADSTTSAKGEVVSDIDVRRSGGFGDGVVVVLVSFRIELARVWVAVGVGRDCVGVVDDPGSFWNEVTL